MVIPSVEQYDVNRRAAEGARRTQATEPPTNDHDLWSCLTRPVCL